VNGELRALNPGNQKRKWNDRDTLSNSVAQKKPVAGLDKSHQAASKEPCATCGWTNHTTTECRVGTNKCMWCRSPDYSIATCPRRQKVVETEL